MKTAVIGAGLAGLTVARLLAAAGHNVTVLDKSKGTGGRLSSRSYAGGWIDHGTPYLSLDDPACLAFLRQHGAAAALENWDTHIQGHPDGSELISCIGVPRTSAVTRALLGNLAFQPSTRIAHLERQADQWLLYNDGDSRIGDGWDLVVIAVPAPQVLPLVRNHGSFYQLVKNVEMEPCWVTALQLDAALSDKPDVMIGLHPALRRVVYNSAKAGRNNNGVYVLQASAAWSQEHLEQTPEETGPQLRDHFFNAVGEDQNGSILFSHRWRYGFTKQPLGQASLWDADCNLGICGDWCLGRSVAHAWRSGEDLARQILN